MAKALVAGLFICAGAAPLHAEEGLVISEIMAANRRTLADQDNEPSDWIEIHNSGPDTVNLDGWSLTDDPEALGKWKFPAVKLKGQGYLLVFASEKNRRVAGAELHTNFKLGRAGDFLALVKLDGRSIAFQFKPSFPNQIVDVSYGLDAAVLNSGAAGGGQLRAENFRYFSTPTPGAANQGGASALAAAPRFVKPGGIYLKSVSVEIAPLAGAKIRYTLNGAEPDANSTEYTAPFEVTVTTVVKARAFEEGRVPGPSVAQTFTILDESLADFSSNLPLMVIDVRGRRVTKEQRTPVAMRIIENDRERNSFTGAGDFDGFGTIRYRGYTSMRHPKRSFAVKLTDETGEPAKAPLLGMPKDNDWILYAPFPDKTLMRDVLAYELSNKMGHWAPRTRFVELFVTRVGARLSRRDYMGVYVLEEKIKRARQRVNITELKPTDNTEPAITGGYIFKKDHQDEGETGFVTSRGNDFFYVEPKREEITAQQRAWLRGHLNRFEKALYSSQFRDPQRGYLAFLDPQSFIDYFWIVEMTKNIDGFRFSTFFQLDRGGKLKIDPIWDWNLSFGNAQGRGGSSTQGWYNETLEDQQYPWYRRLFEDPDFEQRKIDRWWELRRDLFATEKLLKRVDEIAAQLDEAQERNFQRWPILGTQVWPNAYVGDTYEDEIRYMKRFIQRRIAWIDSQIPGPPGINRNGSTASIKGAKGKIYFTLDGSDPRAVGGEVSQKAKAYNGEINLSDGAKLVARVKLNEGWSAPALLSAGQASR